MWNISWNSMELFHGIKWNLSMELRIYIQCMLYRSEVNTKYAPYIQLKPNFVLNSAVVLSFTTNQ